jgi:hypothetical protein
MTKAPFHDAKANSNGPQYQHRDSKQHRNVQEKNRREDRQHGYHERPPRERRYLHGSQKEPNLLQGSQERPKNRVRDFDWSVFESKQEGDLRCAAAQAKPGYRNDDLGFRPARFTTRLNLYLISPCSYSYFFAFGAEANSTALISVTLPADVRTYPPSVGTSLPYPRTISDFPASFSGLVGVPQRTMRSPDLTKLYTTGYFAWKRARGYREFSFSRSGTQAAVEMRPK